MPAPLATAFDYSGKVVLVTGGTKGVGRGITERFLDAGAEVVVTARNEPPAPLTVGGREAVFVPADVRDPDRIAAALATVMDRFGRLDVLVNNAGGSPHADVADVSPRFLQAIVNLNMMGPLYVAQQANAIMQHQGGGSIVNIGSVAGTRPSPGSAAYGAAKAGLRSLTWSLAMEWAPKVRVNMVTGGYILTEQASLHYGDEAGVQRVAETVPMGRLAEPSDIADACLFLASPLARHITGADLAVHGGGERPPFLAAAAGS